MHSQPSTGARYNSSRMRSASNLPIHAFPTASAWEKWLSRQPRSSPGVWLKLAKKNSKIPSVSKPEAIDAALCHGWIDGQLQPYDGQFWLIRFTPRSPRGKWSKINRTKAQQLIAQGRMHPTGHAEIERAKADGRWQAAYAPQSQATVPDDLQIALDKNPPAARFFATLSSANRYAILYRVHNSNKPETRAAKIEKFIAMLARGETVHPQNAKIK